MCRFCSMYQLAFNKAQSILKFHDKISAAWELLFSWLITSVPVFCRFQGQFSRQLYLIREAQHSEILEVASSKGFPSLKHETFPLINQLILPINHVPKYKPSNHLLYRVTRTQHKLLTCHVPFHNLWD